MIDEYNAPTIPIISMPPHDRLTLCCTHLLAHSGMCRPAGDSSLNSAGGGGGGAVAVVGGLHLAPVEAAVAPAGGAHERRRRALRARRHELAAPVHGVPADGRRVVPLALPVVHHLRRLLAPRRRPVRHGPPILLRPHII
ncbi:hypothetical protein BDA96_08G023200 [Sorghum bicolor]|uniref:Uncharacterized protein n=1 Tax=Sorghum bicolor TaxID=4558 RepID=A0A921U6E1_SORBI|nr:hypothetical protein BDA96_08G023200 [Sorghum bicolor]